MKRQEKFKRSWLLRTVHGCWLASLLLSGCATPPQVTEAPVPAPLYLVGGAMHTCTSAERQYCQPNTHFAPGLQYETVNLWQSQDAGSLRILKALLADSRMLSGRQKPHLSLVTASSRDAYGAVDFYRQLFEQLGFQVNWLPVDALLVELMDSGANCQQLIELRRQRLGTVVTGPEQQQLLNDQLDFCLVPEIFVRELEMADVVFFNGGDQSLSLQAMMTANGADRPWLSAIRARHQAGQLIVAGTSAGTALHSGFEMLMGGNSEGALAAGLETGNAYQGQVVDDAIQGVLVNRFGTGLFPEGILDSHASERGRWLRLLTVLQHSRARLAFGIDETTALKVTYLPDGERILEALGEGGVVLLEKDWPGPGPDRLRLHYLVEGSPVSLDGMGVLHWQEAAAPRTLGTEKLTMALNELHGDGLRSWFSQRLLAGSLPDTLVLENPELGLQSLQLEMQELRVLFSEEPVPNPGFRGVLVKLH